MSLTPVLASPAFGNACTLALRSAFCSGESTVRTGEKPRQNEHLNAEDLVDDEEGLDDEVLEQVALVQLAILHQLLRDAGTDRDRLQQRLRIT